MKRARRPPHRGLILVATLALATPAFANEPEAFPLTPPAPAAAVPTVPEVAAPPDWLTDPYGPDHHNLVQPTVETLAAMTVILGGTMINPDFSNTQPPSVETFVWGFTHMPEWTDGDTTFINWVLHPEMGAEIYLLVRNRDYSPWVGFAYSSAASLTWEYLFEGWVEHPSAVDLALTSTVGSLFGEARYQLRQYLAAKPQSTWRDVGIVVADGIEAFRRWVAPPGATPVTGEDTSETTGPPARQGSTVGLALTYRF